MLDPEALPGDPGKEGEDADLSIEQQRALNDSGFSPSPHHAAWKRDHLLREHNRCGYCDQPVPCGCVAARGKR